MDRFYDEDKTGLKTLESLRMSLDMLAIAADYYHLGIFNVDNFKKVNRPPLDYEMADAHLKWISDLLTEVAKRFGSKNGKPLVLIYHIHEDEYIIIFSSFMKPEDIKSFLSQVSGVIDTKICQGGKVWQKYPVEGLPVPGKITLSGGIMKWYTAG